MGGNPWDDFSGRAMERMYREAREQVYGGRPYNGDSRVAENVIREIERMYGGAVLVEMAQRLAGLVGPRGFGQMANAEVDALRAKLAEYAAAFETLKKQACPHAIVVEVRADGVVMDYGGKKVEAALPKDKYLTPGATVKLAGDTLQILDIVKDGTPTGEVATVSRVASPKTLEVDRAGTTRALAYSGTVEEGDRVVLDSSGSVVVANLGKPVNACTFAEATGVTWDDIGGLADAKRALREAVEAPTKHGDVLKRYGKRPIKGVLLYGGPGLGKTMLGKAAASALAELHGSKAGGGFFYVKGPELLDMYVGNTEANIRRVFTAARAYKKKTGHAAIIFLDEADAVLGKRGGFGLSLNSTTVPAFLAEMDGLGDSGALVLLATNRPGTLDAAVVRDGRIDRRIKVTRPTRDEAAEILGKYLRAVPGEVGADEATEAVTGALYDRGLVLYRVAKRSSVGKGAPLTLGHIVSGAMLAGVVDRATSVAMHRELAGGAAGVVADDYRAAVAEVFAQAQDVDHSDEIAEFCEGWEDEVTGVHKVRPGGGESLVGQVVTLARGSAVAS